MDDIYMKNFNFILTYLSKELSQIINSIKYDDKILIQEIRIRVNKPIIIIKNNESLFLTLNSNLTYLFSNKCFIVSQKEIDETINKMCEYSVHSHQVDIQNGYITLKNGSRIGICGEAVYENNSYKNMSHISGINIRIPRYVMNISNKLLNSLFTDELSSILIIGPPSSGKTTILKDIIYKLSSGYLGKYYKISVIDERKELFANVCNAYSGLNTDVLSGFPKGKGIDIAIRTLSPEIIVCDEIGEFDEIDKIISGMNSGVNFIVTAHAKNEMQIYNKKQLKKLIDEGNIKFIVVLKGANHPSQIEKIIKTEEYKYETNYCNYINC